MPKIYANIGGNIGNVLLNITKAMGAIGREFGPYQISHKVESAPWGFDSTFPFVNVGIAFESDLEPHEILQRLQSIEKSISSVPHRNPDGSYASRELDIDIMAIDGLVIDDDILRVPHPHMAERDFFLKPMAELAPDWRHPLSGLTAMEMLDKGGFLKENKD